MTMAPATESVMGSLPRYEGRRRLGRQRHDPAGRRCARRGDHRLGRVERLQPAGSATLARRFGLDRRATSAAQASLGSAQRVGAGLGDQASTFIAGANQIFVDAMAIGMRISVVVVAVRRRDGLEVPPRPRLPRPSTTTRLARAERRPSGRGRPSATVAPPATVALAGGVTEHRSPPVDRAVDAGDTATRGPAADDENGDGRRRGAAPAGPAALGRGRRSRAGGDDRAGGRGRRQPRCRWTTSPNAPRSRRRRSIGAGRRRKRSCSTPCGRRSARSTTSTPARLRGDLDALPQPSWSIASSSGQHERRAAAPDRGGVPRRADPVVARRLHRVAAHSDAADPRARPPRAASFRRTSTSRC